MRSGFVRVKLWFLLVVLAAWTAPRFAVAEPEVKPVEPNAPIIREIRIELRNVFDGDDLSWFYRTVNDLKIATKEEVIRRELLIKVGDRYDEFLVAESERNLRTLTFLRQVSITPVRDGDFVDLIVSVQDTWTIVPRISLSFGSTNSKTAAGIVENNLLGYGKRVEAFYADDEGRQKIEGIYDDARLWGSYQRLLLGHFERSDGSRTSGFYGRPFRSLVDPNSWGFAGEEFDLVGRLFQASEESFIFRQKRAFGNGGYTFLGGEPETLVQRMTFGYSYLNDEFKQADAEDYDDVDVDPSTVSHDPALLADDRLFSGPYISYQRLEPDYLSINFIDRFERVEDFNLGNEFNIRYWYAAEALGSDRDTFILNASDSDGFRLSPTSFVRAEIGSGTRIEEEGFDNTLLHLGMKYYNVIGAKYLWGSYIGKHTLAANISFDFAEDLDRDSQFTLGATDGLRGYDDRTFTGNKRVVLNLEDRFHVAEDVLKLVNVGGAIFTDIGGATEDELDDLVSDGIYADVGIGLRLGFLRATGSGLVRIDLAFPVRDGPDGSKQWEPRLLFTGGQLFPDSLTTGPFTPRPPTLETGTD